MMNTSLCPNVDWVGYVDWSVRDFHGYDTQRGTTYNAYLVRDEQTALIDTVKAPYAGALLQAVSERIEPAQVAYVVCNHAEPDHSGALPQVLAAMPGAALLCNKKCAATLAQHYDTSAWRIRVVGNGETVSLGKCSLQFLDTPMVHWPESMATYLPEHKLLFSMDAFGQHWATAQRFDDEVPLESLLDEAKAYYANIVMPFGKPVVALLDRLAAVPIGIIAPSHGLIWRSAIERLLRDYRDWAVCRPRAKVLVLYDSMWESTASMAEAIWEGASAPGVDARLMHVRRTSLAQIATETLDAAAIAFGSATLNRGMMPMAAAVLNYLKGLRPTGKAGLAFGSYGWGLGGPEAVDEWLKTMDWEILRPPIKAQYRPTPAVLDECRAAGVLLAERARTMGKKELHDSGTDGCAVAQFSV